jgi:prephenate dehydrogenase
VAATESTFKAIRHLLTRDMLVMDVGSTKHNVVETARRVLGDQIGAFVPCHPIAGKESAGVVHATPDLYRDHHVVITPIERTGVAQLNQAQAVWEAIGSRVHMMSPQAHDAALAAVSHLPHLVAFAAVDAIRQQPQGRDFLGLAGPGFRDYTRIAASDPQVWRDILLANRQEVLTQSRLMRERLDAFEQAMQAGDGAVLEDMIRAVRDVRARWKMGQGMVDE